MSVEQLAVEDLGRELGEAISELPEYQTFEARRQAVQESDEAQEMIDAFERERQEFMLARQTGQASQEDLQGLQQRQAELHSLPVMETYLAAQQDLQERLETINEAISEPLAVDFGEEAGGCCHD